jgi:hypothetical protein
VVAFGSGNLTYKWYKNGVPIMNATGTSLSLPSLTISDAATYYVEVTDSIGTIRSDLAVVQLLIAPIIVSNPIGITNVVGSTVTFSVEVTNSATLPIGYRWRRGGTSLTNRVLYTRTDFLTLTNIQLTNAGIYTVVVTNMASFAPGIVSASARLGVNQPMDMDGDGIPDDYETAHGLNKSVNDATLDPDGDGFSNLEEFQAGTDPQDGSSYLRVESIRATGGVSIRFRAVESKTYSILYRDKSNTGEWQTLGGVPARSGTSLATYMVEVTDPGPVVGQRYYRIVTPGLNP